MEIHTVDRTWKKTSFQIRDGGGKLVDIFCIEEYGDTTCQPIALHFSGPNGLAAESYPELLEKLGVAPAAPSELAEAAPTEPTACLPDAHPDAPGDSAVTTDEASNQGLAESRLQTIQRPVNLQPKLEETSVPDGSDCKYLEEEEEEEDGSRPDPITTEDIARIDQMSPDELNSLIEDVDAHEEWEELRREAKQRIECWTSGLEKAHQSPRCGYVRNNGKPCGSPAMKDDSFCYFHSQARVQRDSVAAAGGLELPSLDDRLGVQLAIMRVCGMLVDKSLDEKTGRAVLTGLRLAQRNLGHADALFGPNDPG